MSICDSDDIHRQALEEAEHLIWRDEPEEAIDVLRRAWYEIRGYLASYDPEEDYHTTEDDLASTQALLFDIEANADTVWPRHAERQAGYGPQVDDDVGSTSEDYDAGPHGFEFSSGL